MNEVSLTHSDFEKIKSLIEEQGADAALDHLEQVFSESDRLHELFEILKMKARRDHGLPLLYDDQFSELNPEQQEKFDDQLVEACGIVGEKFFKLGDVQMGWHYMQPIGDKSRVSRLLREIPVNEENADEIVEVALYGQVDPEYGYQLILKNFGTCNSITTFDAQANSGQTQKFKTRAAEMLVSHLYHELAANVVSHIEDQEGKKPETKNLRELIEGRDWLFADGGHHVDTTHLASVVRIARNVRDPDVLKLAIELAEYGSRLDSQFHFQGDEPFDEIYEDHLRLFKGLCGEKPELVEAWFLKKLAEMPVGHIRSMTADNLVCFLDQVGLQERAIAVALREMNEENQGPNEAPTVFEMAKNKDQFERVSEHFRNSNDLLNFSIAEILKNESSQT